MSDKKKRPQIRAEFRKKYQGRVRQGDFTRRYHGETDGSIEDVARSERVTGKGDLTRRRTVVGSQAGTDDSGMSVQLSASSDSISGRVLSVHGLRCRVRGDDGREYACAVRQVLKSLSTDQRHVVASGDRVDFLVEDERSGLIVAVHPRTSTLSRTSRGRQHVIVTNIDTLLVVVSAAEPDIKPGLIDRFLLTAERFGIRAVVCINKVDLVDQCELQPLIGAFTQAGYPLILTSAQTGQGIDYIRALVHNRETALAGQSGVGKSTLLNCIEPGLGLRVGAVSIENQKGRHTTTAAQLIPLQIGGYVFDTPGIRQFQLWDITADELAGLMPEIRPYVSQCRYPNCRHLTEDGCAVKDAVADGRIDARRYDSYCHLVEEELSAE